MSILMVIDSAAGAGQIPHLYHSCTFLARDAFVRTNGRAIAMMFVRLSVCLSGTGVHCDHTVHFSSDFSLWLASPMFWLPDTKACPPTPSRLFPVPPGREVG